MHRSWNNQQGFGCFPRLFQRSTLWKQKYKQNFHVVFALGVWWHHEGHHHIPIYYRGLDKVVIAVPSPLINQPITAIDIYCRLITARLITASNRWLISMIFCCNLHEGVWILSPQIRSFPRRNIKKWIKKMSKTYHKWIIKKYIFKKIFIYKSKIV